VVMISNFIGLAQLVIVMQCAAGDEPVPTPRAASTSYLAGPHPGWTGAAGEYGFENWNRL